MKLYHGSTVAVRNPNIQQGRKATDFGKGFYTTSDFEQAKKWALLKQNRGRNKKAIVSVYEIPDDILDLEFSVLQFKSVTKEWLEFVTKNRKEEGDYSYDLIIDPVADDKIYATIRLYEQDIITADAAIEMLKTHKLYDQLSFHTAEAITFLKFTEAIEVQSSES